MESEKHKVSVDDYPVPINNHKEVFKNFRNFEEHYMPLQGPEYLRRPLNVS